MSHGLGSVRRASGRKANTKAPARPRQKSIDLGPSLRGAYIDDGLSHAVAPEAVAHTRCFGTQCATSERIRWDASDSAEKRMRHKGECSEASSESRSWRVGEIERRDGMRRQESAKVAIKAAFHGSAEEAAARQSG